MFEYSTDHCVKYCFTVYRLTCNGHIFHTILVHGIIIRCSKRDKTITLYFYYFSIRYASQKPPHIVLLKKEKKCTYKPSNRLGLNGVFML